MTSLPPFSHLWKETWNRFGANNNLMLSIGAIGAVPLIALTFLPVPKTPAGFLLTVGLYLIAALWSGLASMAIYASAAHPEIRTIGDSFRLGGSRWIAFFTTQLLEGLAVLVPALLLLGALVAVSFSSIRAVGFSNIEKMDGSMILIIATLIIAGIIGLSFWAYRLTFSGFIVFSENKRNLAALRSSLALTKGRVMELWGKFFVFGLCLVAISIGISIISGISTSSMSEDSLAFIIISSLFGLLSNMILIPLETLFVAVLYHALRSNEQPTIQA
jgi:hypothetical protein